MTHSDNQTISGRLRGISTVAAATSFVVILILAIGFGALFVVKEKQRRTSEILLYLEKSALNMSQVNVTMQAYLLTPDENGIWDEKDSFQDSAISYLTMARDNSPSPEMIASVGTLLTMIDDKISPLENEFEKRIKDDPVQAKEFYEGTVLPALQVFSGDINLARSRTTELRTQADKQINVTLYLIAALTLVLLLISGWIVFRKSREIAGAATDLLEGVCSGLVENAKTVQAASHKVEDSSSKLAEAAGQQASSQQETASSIEEILRILTRNSQFAATNLDICRKGQQETAQGKQVVEALRVAMEDFQTLNERLEKLIQIIADVEAKTNVINDIAFQTRILSFNASVEAARSGEHGKGFAVVAEEVGKLSSLSKDAASEIKELILSSGQAVTEAVRMTQDKINNTREISMRATELFDSFYGFMGQIMTATESMMTAAMEQQTGMEQIRNTMVEVSNTTEVTSESSEKLLSYAKGLASESEAMRNSVHQLSKLIIESAS